MAFKNLEKLVFFKVEFWAVLLLALFGTIGCVLFGWIVKRTITLPNAKCTSPLAVGIATLPDHAIELMRTGVELVGQGKFVQKNKQIVDFDKFSGLKIEDPSFEEDGILLVSAYRDKHRISTVYLYDLKTQERLWEWVPDHDQIVEKTPSLKRIADAGDEIPGVNNRALFRSQHPYLLDDGSVLINSGEGVLVKMDAFGNVVWTSDRHYHHSIERMADGNFIVPIIVNGKNADFRDDGYAIVSPEGEVLEERSVVGILVRNGYQGLVFGIGEWEKDRTHVNSAEPILESDEFVHRGDIVLSIRHLSTVFLYRPSEDRVVWLQTGPWIIQHDVNYLGEGKFSVFGNDYVRGRGWHDYGNSNIYVYDMESEEISTPYGDLFKQLVLRSETRGLQRILDNGDAFVSLTDAHQLIRLNNEKIRWLYASPLGKGKVGALHWSRYFYRDELDLSWLRKLKSKGTQDGK